MTSIDRRHFLATLQASAASGALLGAPATADPAPASAAPGVPAELALSLSPLEPAQQVRLLDALGPTLTPRLQLSWRQVIGGSWLGDNLQQHTRYTASPEGAPLPGAAPRCRAAAEQECDARGARRAHALALLPQAVIVHRGKAAARDVRSANLAGLAERGLRPVFHVNANGSAPENGWLLPLFAATLGLAALDDPQRLLAPQGQQGLARLVDKRLSLLTLQVLHRPMDERDIAPLLDPASETLALYGSPALLEQALRGQQATARGELGLITLQDFVQTSAPSLFAASMLQRGQRLAAAADLTEPLLQCLLSPDAGLAHEPSPAERALLASHDGSYYRRLAGLERLSDGGLLSRLVIDIDAGLRWGADSGAASARHAGARAAAFLA